MGKDIFGNLTDNNAHGIPADSNVTGEREKNIHGGNDKNIWGNTTGEETEDEQGSVWGQ